MKSSLIEDFESKRTRANILSRQGLSRKKIKSVLIKEGYDRKIMIPEIMLPMEKFKAIERGETVDIVLSNGLVRSTKEVSKEEDNRYRIDHLIDGSETYFTKKGIIDVLQYRRSVWEGDIK